MPQLTLHVGSIVQLPHIAATTRIRPAAFRIEQRLTLEDGHVLYKIKSEAEPFDRIIDERELVLHAPGL